MCVINWAEKPYPWNEIGLEWVAELQRLASEPLGSPPMKVNGAAARALPLELIQPLTPSETRIYGDVFSG